MSITTEEYNSLSPQDRMFYLQNKEEMDMVVVNGKLHFKTYNNQPWVTWQRFQELLKHRYELSEPENSILHIYSDFGDWNSYSRPYREHGFYYYLTFDVSEYSLKQAGIDKNAREWLVEWLQEKGFTAEEAETVHYTGGISGQCEDGYYRYKSYGFEVRCYFRDIPTHYLPQKVLKWAKKNPDCNHLIFGKEEQ
jgi:hypothetical protein